MRIWGNISAIIVVGMLSLATFSPATAEQRNVPKGWELITDMAGFAKGCSVRHAGKEINTYALLNKLGHVILIGAWPDWKKPSGNTPVALAIDRGAPHPMTASVLVNLVMVEIAEGELSERLSRARTLHWQMPWGDFKASVSGIGGALDALRECEQKRGTPA